MLTTRVFSRQNKSPSLNKRKLFWYERVLLGIGGLFLIVYSLYYVAAIQRNNARSYSCLLNLKQIGQGFAMYSQDYNSQLPLAIGGNIALKSVRSKKTVGFKQSLGWTDTLQTYLHSDAVFQCPGEFTQQQSPASRSGYTDYWFNANLSGISKKTVVHPTATFLLGEGSDGIDKTDAIYSKSRLPASWLTDQNSPAFRHMGGANYLFVDGHVAWLKPNAVTNCFGRSDCFVLR